MNTITEIIHELNSPDKQTQDAARRRLSELSKSGLSLEDGVIALQGAATPFPPADWWWTDPGADLIYAAKKSPHPEYISAIAENFSAYSRYAKAAALSLLIELPSREAALAYMDLLHRYARQNEIDHLALMPLQESPRFPEIFFPDLLDYLDLPHFSSDIGLLLLCYLQKHLVSPQTILPYLDALLEIYQESAKQLPAQTQAFQSSWLWEESYLDARNLAALCLDLLSYFSDSRIALIFQRALEFSDPRLKYFAVLGLLRQGKTIDAEACRAVAASAEMRCYFFEELNRLGRPELFPPEFRTQAALAESAIVNWLIFPTELGRPPDEIELMKTISLDTKTADGVIDYYIFRFRTLPPHEMSAEGWMAGIAGPFIRSEEPTTRSYGETFSAFDPWDSRSPEEHLGEIQEVIERFRHYRKIKQSR